MKKILILTEVGEKIGFGHYTRCSAIQKEANKQGIETFMLLYVEGSSVFDVKGNIYNWLENKEELKKYSDFKNVLIDSYLAETSYYSFLKTLFKKVFVIDDYNRIKYGADLIINPNVFFNYLVYKQQKAIGGQDFIILRSIFRQKHKERVISPSINHLLITIGGSDFRTILKKLIEITLESDIKEITVIDPEGKLNNIKHNRLKILGRQNEKEMFQCYKKADVIISACGQTLHELASMGKATIGICLDIDQEPNQDYYVKKFFLLKKLKWNDNNLSKLILANINDFQSYPIRKIISFYGKTLINQNGVSNLIKSLTLK